MIRYHARWLLPITSLAIANGTVAVDGQRIAYVGPRAGAPPGDDLDLEDAILLPGLVNSHTHLELTLFRGFLEELDFPRWITTLQRAKEAVMTPEAYADAAALGIAEGLRAGVTTYADTCDSGTVLAALRASGVRGVMYQELFGPEPGQCQDSVAAFERKLAALRPAASPLQRIGISPHAPYTVSDELFRAATDLALRERLPMAIHLAESAVEWELVVEARGIFADGLRRRGVDVQPRGRTPLDMLDQLGVLRARPLLIHCVRFDAGDIHRIAHTQCSVAHCPISNAKLGHGIAPLAELLAAGVPVGLGSDSMASNNRMALLEEARIALLMQRARLGRGDVLSAAGALELATLGGARALGLADRIGSLEEGKDADLAAFPIAAPRGLGAGDPESALLFALGAEYARLVTVAGEPRVLDGRLLGEDQTLADRGAAIVRRIAEWRASPDASASRDHLREGWRQRRIEQQR